MTDFDRAFEIIIGVEGEASDDARDSGGLTKYGISQKAYPNLDINRLTLDEAKVIYERDYWRASRAHELPWPLSLFVFDAAVNQGPPTAVKLLQKAVGVAQDGIAGQRTMAAVAAAKHEEVASLFMADRALRYTGTRSFDRYGRGWLKRLFVISMEA